MLDSQEAAGNPLLTNPNPAPYLLAWLFASNRLEVLVLGESYMENKLGEF